MVTDFKLEAFSHNASNYPLKMRFKKFLPVSLAVLMVISITIFLTSWSTKHALNGGKRFSQGFRKLVLGIASAPNVVVDSIRLILTYGSPGGVSEKYIAYQVNSSSARTNTGYALVSFVSSGGKSEVMLVNISNKVQHPVLFWNSKSDEVNYSDSLKGSAARRQASISSRNRVCHPYLSPDGFLTYIVPFNDIVSVDLKTGKEKWRVQGAFHHSIQLDSEDNFWVCAAVDVDSHKSPSSRIRHVNNLFEDQALVKISKNGRILQVLSVTDLLCKSGLEYLLYGIANPAVSFDPIHLNQVTPILHDSGALRKGDLLVSLRNLSTILLINPESGKIDWHSSGPWMNQHSVHPMDNSTICLLDNHSYAQAFGFGDCWLDSAWKTRLITHNIKTGVTSEVQFSNEGMGQLRIPVEGLVVPIGSNGWFFEDSQNGTIMIFRNKELIFKWSNKYSDGTVGITSWCRYLKESQTPDFLLKN